MTGGAFNRAGRRSGGERPFRIPVTGPLGAGPGVRIVGLACYLGHHEMCSDKVEPTNPEHECQCRCHEGAGAGGGEEVDGG